jgi:Protein of unknown function (DUF1573)
MEKTFRALLLVAVLMFCGGMASAQGGVFNSGSSDDPADPTIIAFEKTTYDLGTYKAGEFVKAVFKFKNVGDADLIIDTVKPSCKCSVLKWTETTIKPGGSGEVSAEIDTADKEGPQVKYFTVIYNGNPPVERVTLNFTVTTPDGAAEQGTTDGEEVK